MAVTVREGDETGISVGLPRRTDHARLARLRAREVPREPWQASVVDGIETAEAWYAAEWPVWGHRKIAATAERRSNLLEPDKWPVVRVAKWSMSAICAGHRHACCIRATPSIPRRTTSISP